jgi:hypothetical protein
MKKYLLTSAALIALCPRAEAVPVPGMNTVETKCISYFDAPTDPIKQPGVYPSEHMHTHYGLPVDHLTNAKPVADYASRNEPAIPFVQNIPGHGQSTTKDLGYGPLSTSCASYGDWAWYAIPQPRTNGLAGPENRGFGVWFNQPRSVSVMTLTWAGPKDQRIYEIPFGYNAIVGNAHATSEAEQDNDHVWWTCGDTVTKSRAPRDCSGGVTPPPGPNPFPALLADYDTKVAAVAAQRVTAGAAIATGNNLAIIAAIGVLRDKVLALDAAVVALNTAAMAPPAPPVPPTGAVPSEWDSSGMVTAVVMFPDCWDNTHAYPNFDVPMGIGREHFYYSTNGSCGAGTRITQLFMSLHFGDLTTGKVMTNPFNADGSMKLSFASGPYYTFHADFSNWWNIGLGFITEGCLNKVNLYGDYIRLNSWFNACNVGNANMERCPAESPPGYEVFAPRGVVACKDQD